MEYEKSTLAKDNFLSDLKLGSLRKTVLNENWWFQLSRYLYDDKVLDVEKVVGRQLASKTKNDGTIATPGLKKFRNFLKWKQFSNYIKWVVSTGKFKYHFKYEKCLNSVEHSKW